MKLLYKSLFFAGLIMAVMAMWSYNKAHADEGATIQILDDSEYPLVIIQLHCEHNDPQVLVNGCATIVKEFCPGGADVTESAETPPGSVPMILEMTLSCRREVSQI